jgi:N-acetylglucosamine-6-sulfatase
MEIATFAPHIPYTPAPRNSHDFPGLTEPRDPSFNAPNTDPPLWLGVRRPLTSTQIREIDWEFRKRAQAVEAVDALLATVESSLAEHHIAQNTYIVFSSDNGYHMGQHRLLPGKQTAFDTDIRVPLIVAGPGVPHDRVVSQVVQNVDLYPTFVELSHGTASSPVDGHSLLSLLHPDQSAVPRWRTLALIEHHGPTLPGDPDLENGTAGGNPPDYEAIRISDREFGDAVYVEYTTTGQREFYDINTDPFELHNTYLTLSLPQQVRLHNMLLALENCHSASACWAAGDPQP